MKRLIENEEFDIDDIYEEDFQGKKGTKILYVFMLAHKRHMERISYDLKQALKVQDVAYFSVANVGMDSEQPEPVVAPAEKSEKKEVKKIAKKNSKKETKKD